MIIMDEISKESKVMVEKKIAIQAKEFNVWFDQAHVLDNISLKFFSNQINCIVGPSGSGKSTLIRSINRINDDQKGLNTKGILEFEGSNIYSSSLDVPNLRTDIGMVFQKPCVFPKSIAENVLFGIQQHRKLGKQEKLELVEKYLKAVMLWKEVSHRLDDNAASLSIGQQQRLCIARALAIQPKVLLLDEPTSSLDPVSTQAIEQLMLNLKKDYTIVFVTHNIPQAQRIADELIFLCEGKVIEQGSGPELFSNPSHPQTRSYLSSEICDC